MYRIAVFSDVHANLPALEAVLAAIEEEKPDTVLCLGDLVDFAPWPNEVIQEIQSRKICTLMGNHDERIAFDLKLVPLAKHSLEEREARVLAIDWTRRAVSAASKNFLASLPRSFEISFGLPGRSRRILFVHASLASLDEYIYEDHPEEDLVAKMAAEGADVLVMGHTHLPYVRSLTGGSRLAVNVGSVGRSKEPSRLASFAMLEVQEDLVEVRLHRVSYDLKRTQMAISESSIPDFYAEFLSPAF